MQPNPWCPVLPSHSLAIKFIPRQGFSAGGEKHRVRPLGEASQAPCRNMALYFDYSFPRRTLRKAFWWWARWKYLTRTGELTSGAGWQAAAAQTPQPAPLPAAQQRPTTHPSTHCCCCRWAQAAQGTPSSGPLCFGCIYRHQRQDERASTMQKARWKLANV